MRELRALVALLLAGAGWQFAVWVPDRFDVGGWYIGIALVAFFVGPFASGTIASLPGFRGSEIKLPATVAGAGGPLLVWLVAIDWETPDGTPAKLLAIPVFLALAAGGGLVGWAAAAMLEAVQEDTAPSKASRPI